MSISSTSSFGSRQPDFSENDYEEIVQDLATMILRAAQALFPEDEEARKQFIESLKLIKPITDQESGQTIENLEPPASNREIEGILLSSQATSAEDEYQHERLEAAGFQQYRATSDIIDNLLDKLSDLTREDIYIDQATIIKQLSSALKHLASAKNKLKT